MPYAHPYFARSIERLWPALRRRCNPLPMLARLTIVLTALLSAPLAAQPSLPDTLQLPTLDITAPTLRQQPAGATVQSWSFDEWERGAPASLATLLQQSAGIYIKTHGLGQLATASARGSSAGHSLVLWNGIPIHSPMLGQLDLSLLPTQQWERVTVQQGGASAHWGSGAMGSVIQLDNQPTGDSTIAQLQVMGGSFGRQQVAAQAKQQLGRWQLHTKVQSHRSRNDFPYRPHPTLAPVRQAHAAQVGYQWAQSLYFRPNARQQWAAHLWQSSNERQLPATLTQTRSLATQQDAALRALLHWKYTGNYWQWNAKVAYLRERLDYRDPAIRLRAESGFTTRVLDATATRYGRTGWRWEWGTTHTHTQAFTDHYPVPVADYRGGIFASTEWSGKRLAAQASLRQGWQMSALTRSQWQPLVPQISARWEVSRGLALRAQLGRHYRLPTLNDRFWEPGGNPDLRPESGWSQEMTAQWGIRRKAWQYHIQATAYHRLVEDWVLWSPAENGSFWSASNLNRVRSRGLQMAMHTVWQPRKRLSLRLEGRYDLTDTRQLEAVSLPRIEAGQPLYYTPRHRVQASLSANAAAWQMRYVHDWVGASLGVQAAVPPYQLGRVELAYRAAGWRAWVHGENLGNTTYAIIENRPMPGRYWTVGATITLSKYHISND